MNEPAMGAVCLFKAFVGYFVRVRHCIPWFESQVESIKWGITRKEYEERIVFSCFFFIAKALLSVLKFREKICKKELLLLLISYLKS
jgi:hypothetical protein